MSRPIRMIRLGRTSKHHGLAWVICTLISLGCWWPVQWHPDTQAASRTPSAPATSEPASVALPTPRLQSAVQIQGSKLQAIPPLRLTRMPNSQGK
ncbi:hypothetical protein KSF73_02230 [Burkholderiaceae bacterium DAT-1]|nr:hypothetical protein [Burkholderiaceae bacterium DAT-1]